jgi:hypothetical protein
VRGQSVGKDKEKEKDAHRTRNERPRR